MFSPVLALLLTLVTQVIGKWAMYHYLPFNDAIKVVSLQLLYNDPYTILATTGVMAALLELISLNRLRLATLRSKLNGEPTSAPK